MIPLRHRKIIFGSAQSIKQFNCGCGCKVCAHPRALCCSIFVTNELTDECVSKFRALGGHLQNYCLHTLGESATVAENKRRHRFRAFVISIPVSNSVCLFVSLTFFHFSNICEQHEAVYLSPSTVKHCRF